MNKLVSETHLRMLTVCDKCCELLGHQINIGANSIGEIRVESCPSCKNSAKNIIKGLLRCPDLNLDGLEKETIHQIDRALDWLKED